MKSAYELAMERLEKSSPSTRLSDEQKSRIAELDNLYRSKIAARELALTAEIAAEPDPAKADELRAQLARELQSLRDELESEKMKVRAS